MRNSITFRVWGKNAIFSDPITKIGGELCTYQVPTYEALKGIASAIYWKPTFVWVIDRVKIVNPIRTESKNIKLHMNDNSSGLYRYTYLYDVEYIVQAHIEWDYSREDLEHDRNENKHHNMAKRYLAKGGKRDLFLGKRECVAFVEPCEWDDYESSYKDDLLSFGIMFHSFQYPNKDDLKLYAHLDNIIMQNGVINFTRPENCTLKRVVSELKVPKKKNAKNELDIIGTIQFNDLNDEEIIQEGETQ